MNCAVEEIRLNLIIKSFLGMIHLPLFKFIIWKLKVIVGNSVEYSTHVFTK